jgi:hypothetical protein
MTLLVIRMTIMGDATTWSITSGESRGQTVKGLVSWGLYQKNMPIINADLMGEACTTNVI